MSVRLVVTLNAAPGKGSELAAVMKERCLVVQKEPGCLEFEVFQSALDPDKLTLLELWQDQAALDVHAALNASTPPDPRTAALRGSGPGGREDYEYNKTR